MEKEFYTVSEAAQVLGFKEQTIRSYINIGRIQAEKIFNSTVISKEQIDKLLDKQKIGGVLWLIKEKFQYRLLIVMNF